MNRRLGAVVIGAGHAGLAASRYLTDRSIDHVVLERGEVANSWRRERWESLRLLTPNWQSRLPGYAYTGEEPDGYMAMPDVVGFISRYAEVTAAPVRSHTAVTAVRREDTGYHVATTQGDFHSRAVVLATGACNRPHVPTLSEALPTTIPCFT